MARSTWTPDNARRREPGRDQDAEGTGLAGPGVTPLEDILTGSVFGLVAVVGIIVSLAQGIAVNTGALLVVLGAALVFILGAIYMIRRGLKRRAWRKLHAQRTGRPYLRAWQRTPKVRRDEY